MQRLLAVDRSISVVVPLAAVRSGHDRGHRRKGPSPLRAGIGVEAWVCREARHLVAVFDTQADQVVEIWRCPQLGELV